MDPQPKRLHVELAIKLYAEGLNVKAIARELKSRGLPGNNATVKHWLVKEGVFVANSLQVMPSQERQCTGCGGKIEAEHHSLTVCGTCAPDNAARMRFKQYGLKDAEFLAMLESQNHRCPICLRPLAALPAGHVHIDHDHKTGKVRGVLCRRCNTGLFLFEDESVMTRATSYVHRA